MSRILCILLLLLPAGIVRADHRAALLIAQGDTQAAALTTPPHDVAAVAKALEARGFRTDTLDNKAAKDFRQSIEAWADTVPTRGTALIYFSGLAVAGSDKDGDDTFLIPVDVKIDDERQAGQRGYGVRALIRMLKERSGARNLIIVIDGFSARPRGAFNRQGPVTPGELPEGVLLCFAAKPGEPAAPGSGALSALASSLVTQLKDESLTGVQALLAASPWSRSTLEAGVTLAGRPTPVVAPPSQFRTGDKAGDEWVNSQGIVFCWCPPGRYLMGSPADMPGRHDDERQVEVVFHEGFWIGKHELTIRESPRKGVPRGSLGTQPNHPLTMTQHNDARAAARKTLTESQRKAGRLPADWEYDLPTEQEWEYAARAGTTGRHYFGEDPGQLPMHANFADKSAYDSGDFYLHYAHRTLDDGSPTIALVGRYRPNPWGLHDMYGNVAEWCAGQEMRGGSFLSLADHCRSAHRHRWPERQQRDFLGFRLVIRKVQPPSKDRP